MKKLTKKIKKFMIITFKNNMVILKKLVHTTCDLQWINNNLRLQKNQFYNGNR